MEVYYVYVCVRMHICMLKSLQSCPIFFVTPWTVARQTPLSMRRFSRQEYWSGLPCPPLGDLPDPGASLTPDDDKRNDFTAQSK